jgi:hypothetical protein
MGDEPDALPYLVRLLPDVIAKDPCGSRTGARKRREDAQKRGLASTVWTEYGEERALGDRKSKPVKRLAGAEYLGETLDLKGRNIRRRNIRRRSARMSGSARMDGNIRTSKSAHTSRSIRVDRTIHDRRAVTWL